MKKETLKKLLIFLIIFTITLSFALPVFAESTQNQGAILFLEKINNENGIAINVMVNPNNKSINAVGVYIDFPANMVNVSEINLDNSFCSLIIDDSIDNINGTANILCGLPSPGINQEALVGQIIFKKIETGWADINIKKESMVLANDGFGTNILNNIESKKIFVN